MKTNLEWNHPVIYVHDISFRFHRGARFGNIESRRSTYTKAIDTVLADAAIDSEYSKDGMVSLQSYLIQQ